MSLVTFYTQYNGATWVLPWDLTLPIENWAGIQVQNNRVIGLDRTALPLVGAFPTFNLTALKNLRLIASSLSGNLPDLTGMPNLEWLNLGGNTFTGSLPNFSNLPALKELRLEN